MSKRKFNNVTPEDLRSGLKGRRPFWLGGGGGGSLPAEEAVRQILNWVK